MLERKEREKERTKRKREVEERDREGKRLSVVNPKLLKWCVNIAG